MYQTFISDMRIINPQVRVIGLTATPYRMTSGIICDKNHILNRVCYDIGVRELIEQGYLCLVRAKSGKDRPDTSNLHVRAGEFIASEVDELMNTNELVLSACIEIAELTRDRKQTLVFCSSVAHVEAVMETLRKTTLKGVDKITGETPAKERADTIEEFRTGRLEYLVNCQVLTTGFDVPSVDCVVLLRPTQSPGLYYQMVGRGFRIAPEKTDCLILDYGENVMRHGPVDKVRVKTKNRFKTTPDGEVEAEAKDARTWECPQCRLIVEDINTPCQCGYDWTAEKAALAKHQTKASEAAILSTDVTIKEYDVVDIYYAAHTKRGADEDAPKTLRVEYYTDWRNYVAEWVCIEHDAWAGEKAAAWWRRRSVVKVPETANEAAGLGNAGALAPATKITVRYGGGEKYPRIIGHELGEIPAEEKGFDSDGYLPF
jgi:DNA repair protein RadD